MKANELSIVKSLIAVAWADGKLAEPEQGMIDGLLWAFDATEADEAEVKEYAKKKRTLKDDIPLAELSGADRELLLAHAALLTHADGKQTAGEKKLLDALVDHLEMDKARAADVIENAATKAKKK